MGYRAFLFVRCFPQSLRGRVRDLRGAENMEIGPEGQGRFLPVFAPVFGPFEEIAKLFSGRPRRMRSEYDCDEPRRQRIRVLCSRRR
jgi:hypothetical protein